MGRDADALAAAERELKTTCAKSISLLPADLSEPAKAEAMCRQALADYEPIDILVNNVGGRRINIPTEELPLADWQRIVDLNLTQAFLSTKLIGGAMLPRRRGASSTSHRSRP